jgi:hypothetical protein
MTLQTRIVVRAAAVVLSMALITGAAQCQAGDRRPDPASTAGPRVDAGAVGGGPSFAPPDVPEEQQRQLMRESARTAWTYVSRNYSSRTGLVRALDNWEYVTIWDIASALGAYHSARGLGLIDDADYRARMDRALATLEAMPLYDGAAYNKTYSARTGQMVDRNQRASTLGYGWSAIDMGRFLVWMKIIAENDPAARPAVQRIVGRLRLSRMVRDGYLVGANLDPKLNEHKEYQEGRLGYEQYAALGFSMWGAHPARALDFAVNGEPADVLGFRVLSDRRRGDMITSEPFVMAGLETGWATPLWEEQARNVLAAQRERFNRTGIVTMVSEDAVPLKPSYFFYYGVLRDGRQFVVRAAGGDVSDAYPRWVSTKAAFGWHALFPSDYTWQALQTVRPAGASREGWTAGVFERSKRPTPSYNLNTAALVLEAAYFAHRKCPLIKTNCSRTDGSP